MKYSSLIRHSYLVLILGLIVLPMGGVTIGYAGNPQPLNGTYHFIGQATCAGDGTGFDESDFYSREEGGGTRTFVQHGEVTYNGDGTGTFTAQVLSVGHQANAMDAFPIGQVNLSCTVTNTVNSDGTFDDVWECETTMGIAGFNASLGFHAEFDLNFQGVIENGRLRLYYVNTLLFEELVTILNASNIEQSTSQRICNRVAHGIRIQ